MSHAARGADWFKLAFANQKPDQNLLAFAPPPRCAPRFAAPADTALPEGSPLELTGVADCADAYAWSAVSGPAPRILDPESKALQITLPRVAVDTSLVFRFTAAYGGVQHSGDVRVLVRKTIPDPVFVLRDTAWSGKDTLVLRPAIANGDAMRSKGGAGLRYAWTLSGAADTAWNGDALALTHAEQAEGELRIGLCLDDGGAPVCHAASVVLGARNALGLARRAEAASGRDERILRDARGRVLPGAGGDLRSRRAFPLPGR
jgi:hypothetical protein